MKTLRLPSAVFRHVLLLVCAVGMAFPFYWMATSALKTNDEIWSFPPVFWPSVPQWHQYAEAWLDAPFWRYMLNSTGVALAIALLQIINSAMMAYAITHMKFRLQRFLTGLILLGYMIPATAVYLPGYITLSKLNLLDSYAGLILSNSVSIFSIFLIRQAFLQVPRELVEAGEMDGASHTRILWTILVPLTRSSFAVMALITFIE